MSCGRILVKGEAEEFVDSTRPRSRQRHGRRSNPFSTSGLDKFQSISDDLSARRECIAKEIGVPESMVRFEYSKRGWIPFVLKDGEVIWKKNSGRGTAGVSILGGRGTAGVSILGPAEISNGEKDGELMRKDERNRINGESEGISISLLDERSHGLVKPWFWILKAFGVLSLSATSVRRSGVPVPAAMAVGGVVCMKKFVLFSNSLLSRNPGNPHTNQNGGDIEATNEKTDIEKLSTITPSPDLTVNTIAAGSLRGSYVQPIEFLVSASQRAVKPKKANHKHKHHHHSKSKAKTFRIVPMGNRPTGAARSQGPDSFYRRTRPPMAYGASAVATALIITLFCLAFYGRLSAIFFTSAWWYVLSMLRHHISERMNRNNNNMATTRNG